MLPRRLKDGSRLSPARGPRAHVGGSTIMNAERFSMSEPPARLGRIAILWRGDEAARRSATPETSRFKAVFAALADVGVEDLYNAEWLVEKNGLRSPRQMRIAWKNAGMKQAA